MKKAIIAVIAATLGMSAWAQTSLVKDLSNQMKLKSPDYKQIAEQIKPALTNPETAGDVEAWVLAGKANINLFDNLWKLQAIGQDVDAVLMGNSLMDGINDYIKALPLDTIVDAKGKTKTKYSKEIIKQINENYSQLNNVAASLYNDRDYIGAYRAWDMVLTIPKNPVLGKNAPAAMADTLQSEVAFNMGIAAWQADSIQDALNSFKKAIKLGYTKKNAYDYAIATAAQLQLNDEVNALAAEAYPLYGNEDPKFLQILINEKINNEQYDDARKMLDEAIAATPNNAQLYFVMGVLDETMNNKEAALADYKKSIEIDPNYAQGLYSVGRMICNIAYDVDDEANKGTQEEYNQIRSTKVDPMFKEASVYLEKAYEIDPDNMTDALRYLRNVYYNLHDEENLKRVENL